jgi:hypothetical protein
VIWWNLMSTFKSRLCEYDVQGLLDDHGISTYSGRQMISSRHPKCPVWKLDFSSLSDNSLTKHMFCAWTQSQNLELLAAVLMFLSNSRDCSRAQSHCPWCNLLFPSFYWNRKYDWKNDRPLFKSQSVYNVGIVLCRSSITFRLAKIVYNDDTESRIYVMGRNRTFAEPLRKRKDSVSRCPIPIPILAPQLIPSPEQPQETNIQMRNLDLESSIDSGDWPVHCDSEFEHEWSFNDLL